MAQVRARSQAVPQNERRFFAHLDVESAVNFKIPLGYAGQPNLKYLGGGIYGNVIMSEFVSRDGETREVAIKKYHEPFSDAKKARHLYRELRLLQKMRHVSVIRGLDLYSPQSTYAEFRDVYVVTEYAGNSLQEMLNYQREHDCQILSSEEIHDVIYQLLTALKYIHSANVMHRDLKPKNLALIFQSSSSGCGAGWINSCRLTLLDFDKARTTSSEHTKYVQDLHYRAPEAIYWKTRTYDKQADIWSVGCIAAELLQQRVLFPGSDAAAQYENITNLCGSPDGELRRKIVECTPLTTNRVVAFESCPEKPRQDFKSYFSDLPIEAVDFLDKILVLDPDRRMSVDEALCHEYIGGDANVPIAEADITLDDEGPRTAEGWREAIWRLIQTFRGNDRSPIFQ